VNTLCAEQLIGLLVLSELDKSIVELLNKGYKHPVLILLYSFMDICAFLTKDTHNDTSNNKIFRNYIRNYLDLSNTALTPDILWDARCSVVHSYSPIGNRNMNCINNIFYYSRTEKREDIDACIRGDGYTNYLLIDVNELYEISRKACYLIFDKSNSDQVLRDSIYNNSKHILKNGEQYVCLDNLKSIDNNLNIAKQKLLEKMKSVGQ
jgi:hypothetical protein